MKTPNFEVPQHMREMADQSVEQARKAFDGFISAAQQAANTVENSTSSVQSASADVQKQALSFAEDNVARSFDYAQKMVRALDVQEVMKLQTEYMQAQMESLQAHARSLGETVSKSAKDATKK